jgi:hypothetical protein
MAYGEILSDKITTSDGVSSAGLYGFKNRIINGDMRIDQRNAGASVTPANLDVTLDRYKVNASQSSKYSVQQNAGSVTPPVGFTNYLGVTSLSAYSITSTDIFGIQQRIEGLNTSDLAWGTASAAPVTLSFWVRSSLTGTFGGAINNSAFNRTYPFTYTITAANTWEKETITIPGDTSGTWLTTNGIGLVVLLGLGVGATYSGTAGAWGSSGAYSATGATSVVGTNGATFYITGVQLEKGSTATSFDYLDYGRSLAQCQRYFYQATAVSIAVYNTASYTYGSPVRMPVTMRSTPTLASGATFVVGAGSSGTVTIASGLGLNASPDAVALYNSAANWSTNANIAVTAGFSAEL